MRAYPRRIFSNALVLLLIGAGIVGANAAVEDLHRLYDFTPVSATNPVLASAKGAFAIPVSEYRGCLQSEVVFTQGKSGPLTMAEKRDLLEKLLDDHLLLWAGWQKNADQKPEVAQMLKSTQNMLLVEAMTQQEVGAKAHSPEEYRKLLDALQQRVFDQTDIHVFLEAYTKLKAAAKKANQTDAISVTNQIPANESPDGLTPQEREMPLATCKVATVTIGDVLEQYVQGPLADRPDLDKQDVLIGMLKQMLADPLLAAKARETGLDKSDFVREKMQLNRNVLTRMWYLDQITAQATAEMKKPGNEQRLKQWYQANLKTLYTDKDESGKEQVVSFEGQHDRIGNDYFEDLQSRLRAETIQNMRKSHKVFVDERQLENISFSWPPPPPHETASAATGMRSEGEATTNAAADVLRR